jgi:hypothetical protein
VVSYSFKARWGRVHEPNSPFLLKASMPIEAHQKSDHYPIGITPDQDNIGYAVSNWL